MSIAIVIKAGFVARGAVDTDSMVPDLAHSNFYGMIQRWLAYVLWGT